MKFEELLLETGDNGPYQNRLLWWFIAPTSFILPWFMLAVMFQVYIPDHWCHVSKPDHWDIPPDIWKNITLPWESNEEREPGFSKCHQYQLPSEIYEKSLSAQDITKLINNQSWPIVSCQSGWSYDKTNYDLTAPSQFDWVCDTASRATQVLTVHSVGNVVGTLFFGLLSDFGGRRLSFYVTCVIQTIAGALMVYMPTYILFLIMKFIAALAFPAMLQVTLIMVVEQVGPDVRGKANMVSFVMWTLGMCVLPLVAYLTRNWVTLGLTASLPAIAFFAYWKFLSESPRWYVSQGKLQEAAEILKKIAFHNNKPVPERLLEKLEDIASHNEKAYGFVGLFKYPRLRLRTCLLTFCWIVNLEVYYGLQLNISNMGGNEFLNFFWLAAIELPSNIAGYAIAEKWGRRWMQALFLAFNALICFLAAALTQYASMSAVVTVLAVISKFSITLTFLIIYMQTSELFPTCVRAAGMGFVNIVASSVGISAPYVTFLGTINVALPYIVFGLLCALGFITSSFMPETIGANLPQTLEDAELFAVNFPYFSWKTQTSPPSKQDSEEKDVGYTKLRKTSMDFTTIIPNSEWGRLGSQENKKPTKRTNCKGVNPVTHIIYDAKTCNSAVPHKITQV